MERERDTYTAIESKEAILLEDMHKGAEHAFWAIRGTRL